MFLWLDLETSGLDPYVDDILEVGAILTDEHFTSLVGMDSLVKPSVTGTGHMDPTVVKMHFDSGLLRDLDEQTPPHIVEVEAQLLEMVGDGDKVTLAGSGVASFDLQFIRAQMPGLAERLNYFTLDVGVLRRFFRLAGVDLGDARTVKHRAYADALQALQEGREYLSAVKANVDSIGFAIAGHEEAA